MNPNRRKALTWALALLLLLLSGDFASRALLYTPPMPSAGAMDAAVEKPASGAAYIEPARAAWREEIATKNLFSEARSMRTAPVDAAGHLDMPQPGADTKAQPAAAHNVILSGIIKNQSGEDVAYLVIDGQPAIAIRQGETAGGVKVLSIQKRSVRVESDGRSFELKLSGNPLIKR